MLLNPSELPKGRLLLHSCCAPCSGAIVEALAEAYRDAGRDPAKDMAIFWSNSNIYDREEYEKRRAEILRYAGLFGIGVIDDDFDHSAWLTEVASGRENSPERGARCLECFRFRLLRAARYASGHGFGTLTTSLASSLRARRRRPFGQVFGSRPSGNKQRSSVVGPQLAQGRTPAPPQRNHPRTELLQPDLLRLRILYFTELIST